ncbi:hypothetical protein ACVWWH_002109 [Sinomonas sp. RB5]
MRSQAGLPELDERGAEAAGDWLDEGRPLARRP